MVKGDGNCFFHALVVQLRRAQVPVVLQDMGPDEEEGDADGAEGDRGQQDPPGS